MSTMKKTRAAVVAAAVAGLLLPARGGVAQTPTVRGGAVALQATVLGLLGPKITGLAATGALADDGDARVAELTAGSIPLLGGASVLHAATISGIKSWSAGDEVASEASVGDLSLTVAGIGITAGFVMATATAPVGEAPIGSSVVEGLTVGGVSIVATGAPNQTVSWPGLTLVLNEVQETATGVTVNALHISSSLVGVDVLVASANAGLGQ